MVRKVAFSVLLLFSSLFFAGCSLKKTPAALQINSTPTANVFIDGKLLGKTPYNNEELKAGEITVKLIPESVTEALGSWEGKVKLNGGVLTLIEKEFAASEGSSSGYTLTLERIKDKNSALISLITDPDSVSIKVDGEIKGFSPLNLDQIAVGDHEIVLSKEGYQEKTLKVKNVAGYKLIVEAKLAQAREEVTPTPSLSPTGGVKKPTPTGTAKITTGPTGVEPAKPYVLIKETETGFLRVRSEAKSSSTELVKIKPGEKYSYVESNSDASWYKIIYAEGKEGWISAKYAEKVE